MKELKNILLYTFIFVIYIAFPYLVDYLIDLLNIDISSWSKLFIKVFLYALEIIPAITFILIYKKELIEKFKDFKTNILTYMDKYIKYWLLGIILMNVTNILISLITKKELSNNESSIRSVAEYLPIYIAFASCICAPIVEELAYRKTIRNIFKKKKLCIVSSGIIFGLAHIVGTYTGLIDLLYIIPYGILGSIFMYIYYDSDNIWTTISIHFMHNTILIIAYFLRGVM